MSLLQTGLKKYIFSDKHYYTKLLTLALPVTLQNLIASSLSVVDTVMVGSLGESQIAAVSIANQYVLLVFLIYASIHSGCGIYISQFFGKKDTESIKQVANIGIIMGAVVSLIFTVLAVAVPNWIISIFSPDPIVIEQGGEFLRIVGISFVFASISFGFSMNVRSIGKSVMPMIVSAIALVINTILNFVLIYGMFGAPALGVKGAAIATLISRIIEMLIFVVVIYSSYDLLKLRISIIRKVASSMVLKVSKTILPVLLNEVCWGFGVLVYSAVYGRISTEAVAAVQIYNTVTNLFMVAGFGLASASAVMIGHKVGEREMEKAREYSWRFVILALMVGALLGGALAISAPSVLTLFNISESAAHSATFMLFVASVILGVRFINIVSIVGLLRGGGDASFAFIIEAITMWCVGVPLALLGAFVFRFPVEYVVLLVMLEEVVKFIFVIFRMRSNKWIKSVVWDEDC